MESLTRILQGGDYLVSIPFKREGTWKGNKDGLIEGDEAKFQFPSNGKVHGKKLRKLFDFLQVNVSIPFKREGTWKD